MPPPWLETRTPKVALSFPNLDPGETAAISLAIELHATLMIDELDGRTQATASGLKVIGVVGILETAANTGIVPELAVVHSKIKLMNFYVSHSILNQSLARHLAFKKAQSSP
jgi:predicted nucleic acid-binding protein